MWCDPKLLAHYSVAIWWADKGGNIAQFFAILHPAVLDYPVLLFLALFSVHLHRVLTFIFTPTTFRGATMIYILYQKEPIL